jgi:Tol biopolymer transport system component
MNRYATVRALCALAVAALAACADGAAPTDLVTPPPPDVVTERPNHVPPPMLYDTIVYPEATITCNATVSPSVTFSCGSPQAPSTGPWPIGGKGTHVRLINTGPGWNAGTRIFQVPIRFQNLLVNRMGTPDGTTQTGLMAFVADGPTITGGSGAAVTVHNEDSTGVFTAANQPYFFYDTMLAVSQSTLSRMWQFHVPAGVTAFQFKVYISAPLLPVIVFDKEDGGNREIYRVALDGSDFAAVATFPGVDMDPTVANGRVVFVSYRNGNADLFSVSLLGGMVTQLTNTPSVNETAPALSHDGTKLVYVSDASGVAKLWIANANATNAAPLTSSFSPGNAVENAPAWDRSLKVAFVSTNGPSADIYTYTPGGLPPVDPGTNSLFADVEPAVSHNGLRIALATNRDGDTEIYVRQSGTARITTRVGVDAQPTFLSDYKLLWVENGATPVLRWRSSTDASTGTIPIATGIVRNPYGVPLHQ